MRSRVIASFACGAFVALVSTAAASAAPIQTFEVTLKNLRVSTKAKPQGGPITIEQRTTMPDGSKPPQLLEVMIEIPPGPKLNMDVASKCDRNTLATNGRCATSSRVATGTGTGRVDFGPYGELTAPIVGYWGASCAGGAIGCIYLYVAEPQTGITFVVDINIYRNGSGYRLGVTNLELPAVLGIEPAVTYVKITTSRSKSFTETVKVGGKKQKRRVTHYFTENPTRCPAQGFTVTGSFKYKDGSSNTVSHTIACPKTKGR